MSDYCLSINCNEQTPDEDGPPTWRTPWWEDYGTCCGCHAENYYGNDVITPEVFEEMHAKKPQAQTPSGLPAEQRLREISRMWHVRTNEGVAFLPTQDVPRMRELLDGYTHPDEFPESDNEAS